MKIAELFETRIVQEGTWALPNTMEKAEKFLKLLEKPIPLNKATKVLYNVVGDDDLFDRLGSELEYCKRDNVNPSRVDARDMVMTRMSKLLQTDWVKTDPEVKTFIKNALKAKRAST